MNTVSKEDTSTHIRKVVSSKGKTLLGTGFQCWYRDSWYCYLSVKEFYKKQAFLTLDKNFIVQVVLSKIHIYLKVY